jgi:hypothetical protein
MIPTHFSHPEFHTFAFESIPLNREVYLMDEKWLGEYEAATIAMFDDSRYRPVGYISYASTRQREPDSIVLSWFPNIHDRFHEVVIRLPLEAFVTCVTTPGWADRPHIFVKGSWLSGLHLRPYSAFALVDAIGVRRALSAGRLGGEALLRMRQRVDAVAAEHSGVAFVSFADSILLKINWFVGHVGTELTYSYSPEILVSIIDSLAQTFLDELGLGIYAAIAQGVNEYHDTQLLHRSDAGNHVSLNSLGLPFAQILSIDGAARSAIRSGAHPGAELYMDEAFYHSLRFRHGFDKTRLPSAPYIAPLTPVTSRYVYADRRTILENLNSSAPADGPSQDG